MLVRVADFLPSVDDRLKRREKPDLPRRPGALIPVGVVFEHVVKNGLEFWGNRKPQDVPEIGILLVMATIKSLLLATRTTFLLTWIGRIVSRIIAGPSYPFITRAGLLVMARIGGFLPESHFAEELRPARLWPY